MSMGLALWGSSKLCLDVPGYLEVGLKLLRTETTVTIALLLITSSTANCEPYEVEGVSGILRIGSLLGGNGNCEAPCSTSRKWLITKQSAQNPALNC